MAKDLLYYFDDEYIRHELGEIQTDFNESFVIDGTKDSAKVEVINFNENEILPYTIVWHKSLNTWWVVGHDNVDRFTNENQTYVYKHTLQLFGAIELLGARDLTDCGFNANKYTFREFFDRLLKLSTFEFKNSYSFTSNSMLYCTNFDSKIDYLKSFENYTLLSAVREFFDDFNLCVKMSFYQEEVSTGVFKITQAYFDIVPKTGLSYIAPINISVFDDERETKTIDKRSYGTTVVSNAENITSTASKTYPAIGGTKVNAQERILTTTNAKLFLPSKIDKVEWLKVFFPVKVRMKYFDLNGQTQVNVATTSYYDFYPHNEHGNQNSYDKMVADFIENCVPSSLKQEAETQAYSVEDFSLKILEMAGTITIRTGWGYNTYNNGFVLPQDWFEDGYVVPNVNHFTAETGGSLDYQGGLYLGTNEDRNSLQYPISCISYSQGNNYIENFNIFGNSGQAPICNLYTYYSTDLRKYIEENGLPADVYDDATYGFYQYKFAGTGNHYFQIILQGITYNRLALNVCTFQVKYKPMTDLKIKVDNASNKKIIQFYNQNGRLTDGNAFSKQLLSYSKSIESGNNLTKYKVYYSDSLVPKVGQIVIKNNEPYVINNVSKTYYQNENEDNIEYFIDCEFTLSKQVAVKSMLTNPNTNIRDYAIPQKYNVKRKQLYRDFYELDLAHDTNANTTWYMPPTKIFNLGNFYSEKSTHTTVCKLSWYESGYQGAYGTDVINNIQTYNLETGMIYTCLNNGRITRGNVSVETGDRVIWNGTTFEKYTSSNNETMLTSYYYQLDSVVYMLKKSYYEVVDFNDNNIIGYDSQNIFSGFDITRVFTGTYDTINTPVSYVKYDGTVKDFGICFVDNDKLTTIYDNYIKYNEDVRSSVYIGTPLYNKVLFAPEIVYEGYSKLYPSFTQTYLSFPNRVELGTYVITNNVIEHLRADNKRLIGFKIYSVVDGVETLIDSSLYTYELKIDSTTGLYISIQTEETFDTSIKVEFEHLEYFVNGALQEKDFIISELNYNKDAIEVPFFEYTCQIDDTQNVIVGENILLNEEDDLFYIYEYEFVDKNVVSQNNADNYFHIIEHRPYATRERDNNNYTDYLGTSFQVAESESVISIDLSTYISTYGISNKDYDKSLVGLTIKNNDTDHYYEYGTDYSYSFFYDGQKLWLVISNTIPTGVSLTIEFDNMRVYEIRHQFLAYNGAMLNISDSNIKIKLIDNLELYADTGEKVSYMGNNVDFDTTKDLLIYRYAIKKANFDSSLDVITDYRADLLFIVRNLNQATINDDNGYEELELSINHYNVD